MGTGWERLIQRGVALQHRIMTLACPILLALTAVVPEASAPHERISPAEPPVRATREELTSVAHRYQSAATDRL